ncbi:MAG: terminase [Terriglobales bacterium]
MADLELLRRLGAELGHRLPDAGKRRASAEDGADGGGCADGPTIEDLLIEGLLKVRSKTRGLVRLRPNKAQAEYSRKCTQRNIVLKARQLGMTTYIAARFFIQTITQPGTTAVQVAHNQESAEEIFKIVHRFWENLPEGMRRGALVTSRCNVRQIVFPRLDSEYKVATAADANAGRGMTIHNLHCSEVARWPRDGMETLASLRAAVPESGEVVLESTPNGAGGVFYEEWQRADETGYQRHFFPWWYDGDYCTGDEPATVQPLSPEEEQLMEHEGLTERQIAWRRTNRAQLRGLAAQEFAEDAVTCFRASGECVFDLEAIQQALAECGEPVERLESGRLTTWFPPQAGRQYILGVDPAGGGSEGDYACAQVIERRTAMQCAELHGHFPPRELAMKTITLGNLYNDALLVVERNNHGYGVLAHLRAQGCSNVFRDGGQDGWLTSAASRPAMVENLAAVLATEPGLFRSRRFLNECRTFVRYPDGNSGAAGGTHDDCVMAMAVALAARRSVVGELSRKAMLEVASLPLRH